MYQVGLMESDKHIQYFWNALESFSQVNNKNRVCVAQRHTYGGTSDKVRDPMDIS